MSTINLNNYEAFLLDYSEGNLDALGIVHLKGFVMSHPELEIELNNFDLPYVTQENYSANFKNVLRKTESEVPDEVLLNYLEGNLSEQERLTFELKLAADKELARDLDFFKKTILTSEIEIVADFKSELLRTEDNFVLNDKLIAYFEKQLGARDKIAFENELGKNKDLLKQLALVSKTVLVADQKIIHPNKASLKKENKVIALFSLRTVRSMAAVFLLLLGFVVLYNYYGSKEKSDGGLAIQRKKDVKLEKNQKVSTNTRSDIQKSLANKVASHLSEKTQPKEFEKKPIAADVQKDQVHLGFEKQSAEIAKGKDSEKEKTLPIQEQKSELATSINKESNSDSILNTQNYLVLTEEVDEGNLMDTKDSNQKGFWKRAVHLAKKANRMGVKSLDGQENSENKYSLSFNSFSVGKK